MERAICLSTIPIQGKSTDDPWTRDQIRGHNARVLACPERWRRKPRLRE